MISMVLQSRARPRRRHRSFDLLEPICGPHVRGGAARTDSPRSCPGLREVIEAQQAEFDDVAVWNHNARRFHETLVARCATETMIVVHRLARGHLVGARVTSVWDEARQGSRKSRQDSPMASQDTARGRWRDHEKMLAAIEAGNEDRAAPIFGPLT